MCTTTSGSSGETECTAGYYFPVELDVFKNELLNKLLTVTCIFVGMCSVKYSDFFLY